jgi:hypothetical protein
MISLRRRDADLRGEHPVIVGVPDLPALGRIRERITAAGYASTAGEHADAVWLEVVDPDGMCLRFAVPTAKPVFFGVTADGFYDTPRLAGFRQPAGGTSSGTVDHLLDL